jgi:hypothetical protein
LTAGTGRREHKLCYRSILTGGRLHVQTYPSRKIWLGLILIPGELPTFQGYFLASILTPSNNRKTYTCRARLDRSLYSLNTDNYQTVEECLVPKGTLLIFPRISRIVGDLWDSAFQTPNFIVVVIIMDSPGQLFTSIS